nr:MAG TPA: hypothetical protein [Caudoviricetes sp.]
MCTRRGYIRDIMIAWKWVKELPYSPLLEASARLRRLLVYQHIVHKKWINTKCGVLL